MPIGVGLSNQILRPRRASVDGQDDAVVRAYFAQLDVFIMDELTVRIGFMPGTYTLAQEGVRWVGDLVCKTEVELLEIPGIGHRRVDRIHRYLDDRGLRLGTPCRAWLAARNRQLHH